MEQEGWKVDKQVFAIAAAISVAFVFLGVVFDEELATVVGDILNWILTNLGWVFVLSTAAFLGFVLFLAVTPYGRIRLGKDDDRPEFRTVSWIAMMFSAGMGIGLMFFGVAEPISHLAAPPLGLAKPGTEEAAATAMEYTYFHWALHPWALYAVVGLALGYFSFRKGMPNLISTVFRPLLGDRVDGPIGKAIDIIAIIATLFGVAVSLGLGTLQIDAGLGEVFGLPSGIALQLIIIAITAVAYMLSASTPINKRVNILSQTSMYIAFALLVYFIIVGPTLLQLNSFMQETGVYLANLVPQSFNMAAFEPQEATWLADWTIFFWATWIAWAPYVGVFIARISKGRTIREFILGVMIAPRIFSMIWFSVFGAAGIQADNQTNGAISSAAGTSEVL